jgi:ribosome-interacting GTPase 1
MVVFNLFLNPPYSLYVYNKIDTINIEDVDRIAKQPDNVVIRFARNSCLKSLVVHGI